MVQMDAVLPAKVLNEVCMLESLGKDDEVLPTYVHALSLACQDLPDTVVMAMSRG